MRIIRDSLAGGAVTTLALMAVIAPAGAQTSGEATVAAIADPSSAAPAVLATDYRVNAGDELEVYVWGEDRLQRTVRVLPDGTFGFPLVGRVFAEGKTPTELEVEISRGLAPQFRSQAPQVTVSVRTPAGMQISIVGKVRNPGSFSLAKYVNVLEALTLAGGPIDFANVREIVILRKEGDRVVPIKVNLSRALRGAPSASDLTAEGMPRLQSGDTVVVP